MNLTEEDKINNITLFSENKKAELVWDDATMTWNDNTNTFDNQATQYSLESKNNIALILEDR